MTTFKATVKKPRSDGFYTVYIRVTHQRKTSYIKTNKIIDPAHITSSGELIWGIERSGFFNGRGKWAKSFENQTV